MHTIRTTIGGALVLSLASASPVLVAATEEEPEYIQRLDEVTVTATRVETPLSGVSGTVDVLTQEQIQGARPGVGLNESLTSVPGVFSQNGQNFAQDLRISIRGSGARAPFGIRGIKILVDGFPATLPDGQSSIDGLDLNVVERIEIWRGPGSALYGNASGGVISIETEAGLPRPYWDIKTLGGTDGLRSYTIKGGGQAEALNYFSSGSVFELGGYREHAATQSRRFNGKLRYDLAGGGSISAIVSAVDSPKAQDPGALTAAEVAQDRRQVSPRNRQYDAGEELDEQRIGLRYSNDFGPYHALQLRGFASWRDFNGRLPFADGGMVRFDRQFSGVGALYHYDAPLAGYENRLLTGFDLERQQDDRQRYDNLDGKQGERVLDQIETVSNLGLYVQNETAFNDRLRLTLGLRYDEVEFDVDDQFGLDASDDSGRRRMSQASPRAGLSYRLHPAWVPYASVSRAFETPTTTELAQCDQGGLSRTLDPQTASNYEIGLSGLVAPGTQYRLALYRIEGRDEIIPIECPNQPGRDYFVNAGATRREGVELGVKSQLTPEWAWTFAYTFSGFVFQDFAVNGERYDDNAIPGIPRQLAYSELVYRHPGSGLFTAIEGQYVGTFYADNGNQVKVPGHLVSNWRLGWVETVGGLTMTVFGGVNNLSDEQYFDNVRLNAFGGRYFEPAPERHYYAGLQLGYGF